MSIYTDISKRTQGDIYIGVVGPVRTGKSTFIKKFMDTLVIPRIDGEFQKERARDELPQSAAGRTIMTTEPKFIPEEAIELSMDDNLHFRVRLIDCVGYIVPSSVGYIEEDQPRMVRTPWFDEEIPFNMAAEIGTQKVINEHSTIGLVVTTDGSISSIPREEYEEAEELEADDSEEYEEAEELEADDSEEYEEVEELEADDSEEYEEAEELKADESEEYEEAEELEADESEEYEEAEELEADDSEEYDDTEELEADDYEEFEEEASEEETWGDTEESEDDEAEPAEAEQEDLTEGETAGEIMENKKKTEPILPPDIQRLIDEIEGVIPPEEPKPVKKEKTDDVPHENMGKVADELRIDDDLELDDSEDYWDDDYDEPDSVYEDEEEYGRDYADEAEEEYYSEYEDEDDIYDNEMPDFEEEFRVNPEHSTEPDDREVPDDDDEEMDILSATTPLSRKETAKLIATGKTSPLPLDEISDALSLSDTGSVVHGRYDLEAQSGIGTRAGLTDEQKKLFSYFVPVRGMSEQLVDVLEQDKNCTNRRGTSRTGNLLIIGNKGNGKTVLAVDVVKAIQKQRNIRQGKVAIVTGESLNKKKIGDIIDKLYGGALIIEKAGKMNEKTVARLNKAMEKDTGELLIVLEEQRKPIDRLLSSNREFRRKFTSRLEVPIFINDELVTFGQTYAQENGYRIDEMGILALYSRIDSLQREDHAVTVAEVKEIMDEAIQHSQKASAKKLVRRVFGKNTDDSDRILLSEKDFNI